MGDVVHGQRLTARRIGLLAGAAFALASAALLLSPASAGAGTYRVWECAGSVGGPAAGPDVGNNAGGQPTGNASTYTGYNDCAGGLKHFGIHNNSNPSSSGLYKAYDIFAPSGTYFAGGWGEFNLLPSGGHQPLVSLGTGSAIQRHVATSTSGWQGIGWTGGSSTRQLIVWLICASGSGTCPGGHYAFAGARNLVLDVHDYVRPSVAIGGSLAGGGWHNSGGTLTVWGSDSGGGVHYVDHYINGSRAHRADNGCSFRTLNGGLAGTRLTPCPKSRSDTRSLGTGSFRQGANTYTGCAFDLATSGGANDRCSSAAIHIDTVAPGAVNGLSVKGGEDWRPSNDFDLSWSNPAQPHAPIAGAAYRIVKVGGGYDSGRQYVAGTNRQSLADLAVPSNGEYELSVWLRDEAGNESEGSAGKVMLRLDDTVPPERETRFNGWLRRHDVPATLEWQAVDPAEVGPSGLKGYAVSVTRDPTADSCVTDADPAPPCSDAEVNNVGIDDTTQEVTGLGEGRWYVHTVPVTGAGVKAEAVRHTSLPVDKTDPSSSIDGVPGRWVNRDVTITVSAADGLSGMSPDAVNYPEDPQPRTCMQVGGRSPQCEPDADLTRVLSGEGAIRVRYWARDLAGNENSGTTEPNGKANHAPRSATVRIDRTAPQVAFADRLERRRPSLISAIASDGLSGVAGGRIELRRRGSGGSWIALDTALRGGRLEGEVPDDLEPGRYEFRVRASDRAGNSRLSSRRLDGSEMVEDLPLKEGVKLTASIEGTRKRRADVGKRGRAKARIPYGKPATLRGSLRSLGDLALRAQKLRVTERFANGARQAERTRTVATDDDGSYAIRLKAGPSRTVLVTYAGTRRYRRAESAAATMRVRTKILRFRVPRRVRARRAIRFDGRIGVRGVKLGRVGKLVHVQYEKAPGRFKTIDSGRARKRGAFHLRYALRSSYARPTRVRFRIVVPRERGWPYAGNVRSRKRTVTILP